MTTDNTMRDIDTLMHMSSFQDMSDNEIKAVIEKREELAKQAGADSVAQDLYADMEARLIAQAQAAQERAEAAFNNAVNSTLDFIKVVDNG